MFQLQDYNQKVLKTLKHRLPNANTLCQLLWAISFGLYQMPSRPKLKQKRKKV